MEPRFEIDPNPYENDSDPAFATPFFRRFIRHRAATPLHLSEDIARDYPFPTFYADVAYGLGLFGCSYAAAERIVTAGLGHEVRPVRVWGGGGLLGVALYDYHKVEGMAPYSEIAVALPVTYRQWWSMLPLLPLVPGLDGGTGSFVIDMPMTSKENQIRGNRIWGLPKTTRRVDIEVRTSEIAGTAYGDDNAPYLEIVLPRRGRTRTSTTESWVFTRLDDTLLRSRSVLHGAFRTWAQLRRQRDATDGGSAHGRLRIGQGAGSAQLRELQISSEPFLVKTGLNISSIFDLPDRRLASPVR